MPWTLGWMTNGADAGDADDTGITRMPTSRSWLTSSCSNAFFRASLSFSNWRMSRRPHGVPSLTAGAIAGGYGGAGVARKLGRRFARRAVIVIGLAMAVSLLFRG